MERQDLEKQLNPVNRAKTVSYATKTNNMAWLQNVPT